MTGSREPPLTHRCHAWLARYLTEGDTAVDATTGNGHDTLFLANCVGLQGRVFGFDIQPAAIEATRRRLQEHGLNNVELIQASHAGMHDCLPEVVRGQVAAVMFNLGYLPRGDKRITTRAETTLRALDQAMTLLRPGGMLSVMAYPGHPGGDLETRAVTDWMAGHPGHERHDSYGTGPCLYLLRRQDSGTGDR